MILSRNHTSAMEDFPVGVRFHPTDAELVGYYLRNKAKLGDAFQSPYVSDCPEFYGKREPWTIWDKYGGNSYVEDKEPLFFFTKRKKLNPKGTRFDRKVGSGTWSGQYTVKVKKEGEVIGIKRDFRYEFGSDEDQNNAWLMDEYELNKNDVTVLCVLRKNPTKPPPPQAESKEVMIRRGQIETKEEEEGSVYENQRKRKMDNVVGYDLELYPDEETKLIGDVDQRRKLRVKRPKTEETFCEEQGGSSLVELDQSSSGCWTTSSYPEEDYWPELVPDLAADDDEIVYSVYDFLAPTADGAKHVESSDFLDQFYENNFDLLAKRSFK